MKPVLFVGNGLNLLSGNGRRWSDLLDDLADEPINSREKAIRKMKPFTLRYEEIVNALGNSTDHISAICNRLKKLPHSDIHTRLMKLPIDEVLTTNYDYALENSIDDNWTPLRLANEPFYSLFSPASRVSVLMRNLLRWLQATDAHPLVASGVFHYEFEFIHPFADGNGRMGRLWQTLILSKWQPLFAYIPVESMVHKHQEAYYAAIRQSTAESDSSAFVLFMLERILEAINSVANEQASPHDTPHVTPQVVELLKILVGEISREDLMIQMGLSDRKSFSQRYLQPAMQLGLIEMTLPDKPRSKLQCYRLTAAGKSHGHETA